MNNAFDDDFHYHTVCVPTQHILCIHGGVNTDLPRP